MAQPNVQLVCFDLGGVLVRIHHDWPPVFAALGWSLPAIIDDESNRRELLDAGLRYETGRIDEAAYLQEAAALTRLSVGRVAAALDAWLIEPYDGARRLLERVTSSSDAATACLSNTNATHWAMMHSAGRIGLPLERLTYRFASHLIGAMKPDPRIYEHVEQTTGAPPPGIVFFDDRPENVEAARHRGWLAEQVDEAANPVAQMTAHLSRHGLL